MGRLSVWDCDRFVLRFAFGIGWGSIRHSVCPTGTDCRVRYGMDATAPRGTRQHAGPVVYCKDDRCSGITKNGVSEPDFPPKMFSGNCPETIQNLSLHLHPT